MRNKITLINADFGQSAYNKRMCLPHGILYLASILENKGFKVNFLDYNLTPKTYEGIEKDIRNTSSRVYAISSLLSGYNFIKHLIPLIRKVSPDSKIILGGPIAYKTSEIILKNTGADIVIEGEAEALIIPLIEELLGNSYKKDEKRVIKSEHDLTIHDLDAVPFPAWHLADVESYITKSLHAWHSEKMRSLSVIASRGCPYKCNFCCKSLGSVIRLRSLKNVIAEIQEIIGRYNVDDIWFTDEEFALTEKRAMELCEAIGNMPQKITFACSMRVDIVTGKLLKDMKKAGCRRIIYGVESGSQKILDEMNKGFTVDEAARTINETRKHGIEAYVNFMFGYPGETEETIRETVDFMKRFRLYSSFGFTTPLPGTRLFSDTVRKGRIKDLELYLENPYCGRWIRDERLIPAIAINLTEISDDRLLFLREQAKKELLADRLILKE